MTTASVVGSTGLVGRNILSTLLTHPSFTSVTSIGRRAPPVEESAKLQTVLDSDSTKWAPAVTSATPTPSIFFSALGTTARQAGSFEAQRKIDYDLNVELARAAKEAGVKVYVLISTSGANPSSFIPYSKMKGELDEAVKEMGFEHTVLVKPGLIKGTREDSRPPEYAIRMIAGALGKLSTGLTDFWSQDADVIAKAAVSAGLKCLKDKDAPKVLELGQSDIVRLGRTEWKQ